MTIKYVKIGIEIFQIQDLSLAQKVLLAMVAKMPKGLLLTNGDIGKILLLTPNRVSDLLADLERKGYVVFKNRQSRWRRIYLNEKNKVTGLLLPRKQGSNSISTSLKSESTSLDSDFTSFQTVNITKGNKGTEKTESDFISEPETHSATPEEIETLEAEGLI